MNEEQQRIAIAEACGWKPMECRNCRPKPCSCDTDKPNHNSPPNYLNDLNAMHEAEQTLWEKDWTSRQDFVDNLARILSPIHGYRKQSGLDLLDATAAQRAEAFLRTINKWEETTL